MLCEHLISLEDELKGKGIKEIYRGQPWTDNCREWVYYDCVLENLDQIMDRLGLDKNILKIHSLLGTHDGQEYGLVCTKCKDGIMGTHPEHAKNNGQKEIIFK